MIIDDFVCLGRTVPEESTTYGHRVCMAGYSESMRSLVRVYPLTVQNPLRQRHVSVLSVERNPRDCRSESWKLKDIERGILESPEVEIPMPTVRKWLRDLRSDSLTDLNKSRFSLGVLEVRGDVQPYFQTRAEAKDPETMELFRFADADPRPRPFGASALDIAPRLKFHDQAGKPHDLQVREWGAYEWVRKNRDKADQLWSNYRLHDGRPTLLLVGNMNNHRNVWLIINIFKDEQADLPLFGRDES